MPDHNCKTESLFDLVGHAIEMLSDRSKQEQDLIYHIAKLDNESRTAIVLAYQNLYHSHNHDEEYKEKHD